MLRRSSSLRLSGPTSLHWPVTCQIVGSIADQSACHALVSPSTTLWISASKRQASATRPRSKRRLLEDPKTAGHEDPSRKKIDSSLYATGSRSSRRILAEPTRRRRGTESLVFPIAATLGWPASDHETEQVSDAGDLERWPARPRREADARGSVLRASHERSRARFCASKKESGKFGRILAIDLEGTPLTC